MKSNIVLKFLCQVFILIFEHINEIILKLWQMVKYTKSEKKVCSRSTFFFLLCGSEWIDYLSIFISYSIVIFSLSSLYIFFYIFFPSYELFENCSFFLTFLIYFKYLLSTSLISIASHTLFPSNQLLNLFFSISLCNIRSNNNFFI